MKKYIITGMTAAVILTGCAGPMNNTERGAATGAVIGGLTGAIIGHQKGRGAEGAAIGAIGGGLLGGAVGNSQDKKADNK
jgi:uncharacterized protein YcfJ